MPVKQVCDNLYPMAYTYKKDPSMAPVTEETRRERVRKKLSALFRKKDLPPSNIVLEKEGEQYTFRDTLDEEDWVTLARQEPEGITSSEPARQNGVSRIAAEDDDDDDEDIESRELRELWLSRLRRESMEEQIARACGTTHRRKKKRKSTAGTHRAHTSCSFIMTAWGQP